MMVQVFLYEESDIDNVTSKAKTVDKNAEIRNYTPLCMPLKMGDVVDVEFSLTDKSLVIDEPMQRMIWQGRFTSAEFFVDIPSDYKRSTMAGTVVLSVGGFPVGKMKFITTFVSNPTPLHAAVDITRFKRIFMSYSHKDSKCVISMAEGFKLSGNVEYFLDRHTLRSGDDFEKRIHEFIDSSDAFVLFWSKNAAQSKWVEREYTWAIDRKRQIGDDGLVIHPLHIKPQAEVPEALGKLHFSMLQ